MSAYATPPPSTLAVMSGNTTASSTAPALAGSKLFSNTRRIAKMRNMSIVRV